MFSPSCTVASTKSYESPKHISASAPANTFGNGANSAVIVSNASSHPSRPVAVSVKVILPSE